MVKRAGPDIEEWKAEGGGRAIARLSAARLSAARLSEALSLRAVPRSSLDVQPVHPPLSAVIWDFVEPRLESIDDMSFKELQRCLAIAISVWGAVVLEQRGDDPSALREMRDGAFKLGAPASHEMLDLIDWYRRRKLSRYGDDQRLCISFELSVAGTGYDLDVVSYDLDEKQDRNP